MFSFHFENDLTVMSACILIVEPDHELAKETTETEIKRTDLDQIVVT